MKTSFVKNIEYAGWIPAYNSFGNCGSHPLFNLENPPLGYNWSCSKPLSMHNISLGDVRKNKILIIKYTYLTIKNIIKKDNIFLFLDILKLSLILKHNRVKVKDIILFILSRDLYSQVLLPRNSLLFFPSIPFTINQNKWMIEIEDTISMMWPFVFNGKNSRQNYSKKSFIKIFKTIIESENCCGIITHMESTARSLPVLFGNNDIKSKIFYSPLGISHFPNQASTKKLREENKKSELTILFTNSWHQLQDGFFFRGGLDVLEAFRQLRERYSNINLFIRSKIPDFSNIYFNKRKINVNSRVLKILQDKKVRIFDSFLERDGFNKLLTNSDVYLLPAARIHVVSILEAMSYGLLPIVSDGWGFDEYIQNGTNGIVLKGRYGITSWMDDIEGILKENYLPMFTPDPTIVAGIVNNISDIVESKNLLRNLQIGALTTFHRKHSFEKWNENLKKAFDQTYK